MHFDPRMLTVLDELFGTIHVICLIIGCLFYNAVSSQDVKPWVSNWEVLAGNIVAIIEAQIRQLSGDIKENQTST
jgi:hypothetical protein